MLSPKPIDLLLFEPDRIHSCRVHPRLRLLRNRKPRSARGAIACESIKCHSIHWTHVKLSFADQPNITSSKWPSLLDPECVYHTHIPWCIYVLLYATTPILQSLTICTPSTSHGHHNRPYAMVLLLSPPPYRLHDGNRWSLPAKLARTKAALPASTKTLLLRMQPLASSSNVGWE